MNRKKRKSLDDSLASEFVFGQDKPEEVALAPDIEAEEEVTAETKSTPTTPMPEKPAPSQTKNQVSCKSYS